MGIARPKPPASQPNNRHIKSNAVRQLQNNNHKTQIKQNNHIQHQQQNKNINNESESEEDGDMFGGMMMNDDDDEEEEEENQVVVNNKDNRKRAMSVEELNKLSEEDRLTMALQMSMGKPPESNKSIPTKQAIQSTPSSTSTSNIINHNVEVIDKANIEWPSMPNQTQTNDDANNDNAPSSAFGFDLGANDEQKTEDNEEGNESMFADMDIAKEPTSPSPPIAVVDDSILSQLKSAELQHQRIRKRIWRKIKQCIERAQDIKDKESELNNKLIAENDKKMNAENAKKSALQNADFEEAEKAKNLIRRAMKNQSDINHQLTKCGVDLKAMNLSKTEQETIYIEESGRYKDKLNVLYKEHKDAMSVSIDEEFHRIEKEEKKI